MRNTLARGRVPWYSAGMQMKKKSNVSLFVAILFVAATLRAPITAVGPIAGVIRESLSISNAAMGLITTIPLMMFALLSPLAGTAGVRYGVGRVILLSLCCTLLGLVVRSCAGAAGVFIGMVCIGVGMTFGNVLLPSIIKSELPERAGLCTSLFSVTMAAFAALASGVSVPLCVTAGWGWRPALAVWGALALAAVFVFAPHRKLTLHAASTGGAEASGSVWRSGAAWWMAGYMAAQAFIFYFFVAWLPTIAQSRGVSQSVSGAMATAYQLASVAGMLFAPNLAMRRNARKPVLYGVAALYILGVSLFLLAESGAALWTATILCGVCTGACFSIVLLLLALRAENPARAAKLSGMVQSVGYAAAAVSPTLSGYLFDRFGDWRAALAIMFALAVFMLLSCVKIGSEHRI